MIARETIMYREIYETPSVLKQLKEKNSKVLSELASALSASGMTTVSVAARGTSSHAALYFKYLAESYTAYPVHRVFCSVVTVYDGVMSLKNSLVIGISQSGKAVDVLSVLERAKAQGAVTVAVTNDPESPLAKCARFHLDCACGEEKSVAATKTFSAQCYLLTLLCQLLSENKQDMELAALLARLPSEMEGLEEASDRFSDFLAGEKEGFFLARGLTYPLSLEGALKLQETAYQKVFSYAYSDFQHGPMAMVGKGTMTVLFAPYVGTVSAETEITHEKEVKAFADKMEEFGATLLVVTDCDAYDKYRHVIKLANVGNEIASFFLFALFLQLSACKVSCMSGNNPDSPRALKKVTITK